MVGAKPTTHSKHRYGSNTYRYGNASDDEFATEQNTDTKQGAREMTTLRMTNQTPMFTRWCISQCSTTR